MMLRILAGPRGPDARSGGAAPAARVRPQGAQRRNRQKRARAGCSDASCAPCAALRVRTLKGPTQLGPGPQGTRAREGERRASRADPERSAPSGACPKKTDVPPAGLGPRVPRRSRRPCKHARTGRDSRAGTCLAGPSRKLAGPDYRTGSCCSCVARR